MIGMRMGQWQRGFFDREHVKRSVDKTTRRALSRFGAFVRQRARTSIRSRKAPSQPGQPPSSHNGQLKRGILFAFEAGPPANVVIGAVKLNIVYFNRHRQPVTGTVPEVLEEGGQIGIFEVLKFGRWQRADLRSRRRIAELPDSHKRHRTVTIKRRPFMRPAFQAELRNLPRAWRAA